MSTPLAPTTAPVGPPWSWMPPSTAAWPMTAKVCVGGEGVLGRRWACSPLTFRPWLWSWGSGGGGCRDPGASLGGLCGWRGRGVPSQTRGFGAAALPCPVCRLLVGAWQDRPTSSCSPCRPGPASLPPRLPLSPHRIRSELERLASLSSRSKREAPFYSGGWAEPEGLLTPACTPRPRCQPGHVLAGSGAGLGVQPTSPGPPGDVHGVLLPLRGGLEHGLRPLPRPRLRWVFSPWGGVGESWLRTWRWGPEVGASKGWAEPICARGDLSWASATGALKPSAPTPHNELSPSCAQSRTPAPCGWGDPPLSVPVKLAKGSCGLLESSHKPHI